MKNDLKRPVQYFSDEYLRQCRKMTLGQRIEFVESFRELMAQARPGGPATKSKLISLKVPEDLLETFRKKAELEGVPYQTKIKQLMRKWLSE